MFYLLLLGSTCYGWFAAVPWHREFFYLRNKIKSFNFRLFGQASMFYLLLLGSTGYGWFAAVPWHREFFYLRNKIKSFSFRLFGQASMFYLLLLGSTCYGWFAAVPWHREFFYLRNKTKSFSFRLFGQASMFYLLLCTSFCDKTKILNFYSKRTSKKWKVSGQRFLRKVRATENNSSSVMPRSVNLHAVSSRLLSIGKINWWVLVVKKTPRLPKQLPQ